MRRVKMSEASSFGRDVTVRMSSYLGEGLYRHMRQDAQNEQMAFGLGHWSKTADGALFLVDELLFPGKGDLREQSAVGVCPTLEFQSTVYFLAFQRHASILEFHTHPGAAVPRFSGIDDTHAHPNAEYIRRKFPEPTTLIMIVGNNRFDAFDGVAYDRHVRRFRQLDRFEVLGKPNDIHVIGEEVDSSQVPGDEFDRQRRIPGWNQLGLERQRIGIIGAGGNGSHLLQSLISIGAAKKGFVAIADHDRVEHSNLPRLPFGFSEQIGTPKVTCVVGFAAKKSPETPVYAFPCKFNEEAVLKRMKQATVLFYCGDNHGGRKEANEFAVRYNIPLIDLACDIQVCKSAVVAGGHVRLVLPGENACLVCCGAFDPAQAANDQMDDISRAQRAANGYVVGADAEATPSVANLNALTAQLAVNQFLALVCGRSFAQWDYLHFDQFTGRTLPARSKRREDCPVCGAGGCFSTGDSIELRKVEKQAMRLEVRV